MAIFTSVELGGKTSEKHFHHRLESVRGIAALFVALHHSLFMIATIDFWGDINRGLLGVFYGRGAVICFFVLSGLVLGESLKRAKQPFIFGTINFYIRRLFRIYPALIVALGAAFLIFAKFGFWKTVNAAESVNYTDYYKDSPTFAVFWNNIRLHWNNLVPPTWSLMVEIQGSLMLPILHLISKTRFLNLILLIALYSIQYFGWSYQVFGEGSYYLWMFYFGYLIPGIPSAFFRFLSEQRICFYALLCVSILIFVSTYHFGHHRTPCCLALGFIIATIAQSREEKLYLFLDLAFFRFYGRISYSFYLIHWIVVYSFASVMFHLFQADNLVRNWPLFALSLAALSIAAATILAWANFHLVEKPFVIAGKFFGRIERKSLSSN